MRLVLLALFMSFSANAQLGAVKAVVTKSDGEQLEGFVKNVIASKPVSVVSFSTAARGKFQNIPAWEVEKIVLKGKKELLIQEVEIDNGNNNLLMLERVDRHREFTLEKKRLYLELLVDGEVPLYRTRLDNIEKFFIRDQRGKIVQLLFKKFLWKRHPDYLGPDRVEQNNYYHGQLSEEARCLNKKGKFDPPEYAKLKLVAYFKRFNSGNCGK
ncbi:hypothetical protein [Flagellimonas sp.]|uniref:hypothetical protein n=1 Tax=Flagellimonas sp. TaxID=2058762 RepID=UPI003B52B4D1